MTLKKLFKRFRHYVLFLLLTTFVVLGSWCVPPAMMKRVVEEIKARYGTELVVKDFDKKENS